MRDRLTSSIPVGVRCCLVGLLISGAGIAGAQVRSPQGSLHVLVTDALGAPIDNATVSIIALDRIGRTNARGRYSFARLPRGELGVDVRRLGYDSRRAQVIVTGAGVDSVWLRLLALPSVLAPVEITERQERRREGIRGFHDRRARGLGTFITREQIDARSTSRPSDVLRTIPGVRLVRVPGGLGIRFITSAIVRRDCVPMMWLDGQRAPGMELDDVLASDVEGIELYSGPSTTPLMFSPGAETTCGTIVVWTREPGR